MKFWTMRRSVFVFDTNALISAFLIKHSTGDRAFRKAASEGMLAMSEPLMREFLEVLYRNKFDRYFLDDDERLEIIREVETHLASFSPKEKINVCRDPAGQHDFRTGHRGKRRLHHHGR